MPIEIQVALIVGGLGLFGWLCVTIYNSIVTRIESVETDTDSIKGQQLVDNDRWQRQEKTNSEVSTVKERQAVTDSKVETHSNDIKKLEDKLDKIDGKMDQQNRILTDFIQNFKRN